MQNLRPMADCFGQIAITPAEQAGQSVKTSEKRLGQFRGLLTSERAKQAAQDFRFSGAVLPIRRCRCQVASTMTRIWSQDQTPCPAS